MEPGHDLPRAPTCQNMEITFRFTGALRSLIGHRTLTISLIKGTTLRAALLALADLVPADFAQEVIEPIVQGGPFPAVLLLNRSHVVRAEQLEQPVGDDDIIAFVEPMEGG